MHAPVEAMSACELYWPITLHLLSSSKLHVSTFHGQCQLFVCVDTVGVLCCRKTLIAVFAANISCITPTV